jgi:hypothetical protein
MAGAATAGVVLHNFHLPKGFAGRGGCRRNSTRRSQEDMLFLLVLVHRQEFFLLGVKEADDVAAFQDIVEIFPVFHKQRNLPRRRGIDHVDFLAAWIVWQFVIGCNV